jgi:hypothetical protein
MTIEDDILSILVSHGYGEVGKDILVNRLPAELPTPDNAMAIFSAANPPQSLQIADRELHYSIIVRNVDYDAAYANAIKIYLLFDRQSYDMPSGRHIMFQPSSAPNFLLFDEQGRTEMYYSFSLITTL